MCVCVLCLQSLGDASDALTRCSSLLAALLPSYSVAAANDAAIAKAEASPSRPSSLSTTLRSLVETHSLPAPTLPRSSDSTGGASPHPITLLTAGASSPPPSSARSASTPPPPGGAAVPTSPSIPVGASTCSEGIEALQPAVEALLQAWRHQSAAPAAPTPCQDDRGQIRGRCRSSPCGPV